MPYPGAAELRGIVSAWHPIGPRDPSLLVFAYAAMNQAAPSSPQALDTWAQQQYAWVNGTHYWDIDFLLAYEQATGHAPSGPADFTAWLAAHGLAVQNPDGSYAKSGQYPIGGTGYPPAGDSPAPAAPAGGAASGGSAAPKAASGTVGGILAAIEAHPQAALAVGGGVLLVLLLGRR